MLKCHRCHCFENCYCVENCQIFQEGCSLSTSPPSHDRTTSDDLPTPTKYSPLPSPTLPTSKEETGDHNLLVHLVDRIKAENGAPESELITCLARLLTLKVRSSCCIAHFSLIWNLLGWSARFGLVKGRTSIETIAEKRWRGELLFEPESK